MTYEEFKERTTKEVSYKCFKKWEKMYMAGHLDKDEFCAMVKSRVQHEAWFEVKASYDEAISSANEAIEHGDYMTFLAAIGIAKEKGEKLFIK